MLRSGAALVLVASMALLMLSSLIERAIFHPTPGADVRLEEIDVPGSETRLLTEDGVRLHAFHLTPPATDRAILFLHGNAGNASHRLPNAAALARLGADVFLLDYRGYGLSEGTPSEAGCYADARAALAHLTGELGVPERRIVVFGRSLGGAVAVDLARGRDLAGVILESTFTSGADVAGRAIGSLVAPLVGKVFASDAKIAEVRSPLLFFHGDRDEIVAFDLGRKLFELANEPKSFETLTGAGHNDTVQVGGAAYFARIGRFLDQVAP